MPGRAARVRSELPVEQLIAGLTADELREVVSAAVDRHGDVERQVRLIAARGAGDLAQLRRRSIGVFARAGSSATARALDGRGRAADRR